MKVKGNSELEPRAARAEQSTQGEGEVGWRGKGVTALPAWGLAGRPDEAKRREWVELVGDPR